jgi:trimethylamine--corrinoid protein Co-methyltransferase
MTKATGQDLFNLVNPAAPLTYYENVTTAIQRYVEEDTPCHFVSGTVAGSTGPATIAGEQLTENACNIAGIVLAQILSPGARIWLGNMTMVQNMRTGSPAFGAIENSLNEVIYHQYWRKHKIPAWSSACAWCSGKTIDFQSSYETSMAAVICALAGASLLFFQGGFTAELTMSIHKAILDDEVAAMIGRFLRGVEVNDDTLPVDLINSVGPIPGHFLNTAHTREWWKKEQFVPQIADRSPIPVWINSGKKAPLDYAIERMDEILKTHKVVPLPADQERAIEDILKDAREYYRKKGLITEEEWKLYQEDLSSPNYPYA